MVLLLPGDQCKTEAANGKSEQCQHEKFCPKYTIDRFCYVCKILSRTCKGSKGVALFGSQCTHSFPGYRKEFHYQR